MKLFSFHSLRPRRRSQRGTSAFTLVEVSIAVGVASFALVGILGVLPLAMDSQRQSIDQTRAAALANTLFASFRAQPYTGVRYLDAQFKEDGYTPAKTTEAPVLDLSAEDPTAGKSPLVFYATIAELSPSAQSAAADPRFLHFVDKKPSGAGFVVNLRFAANKDGQLPPPYNQLGLTVNQSTRVEVAVSALDRPRDVYRFTSVIADRAR